MEKIRIKNIGPIKECEFDIKPINIFIGPQATGKSTIAKLVFCFKSFYNNLVIAFVTGEDIKSFFINTLKKVIGPYLSDRTEIKYFFSQKIWIELRYRKNAIEMNFSDVLDRKISELLDLQKEISIGNGLLEHSITQEKLITELKKSIPEIFQKEAPIFIPAGRLVYSYFPERKGIIDRSGIFSNLEPMMVDFDWKRDLIKSFLSKFQDESKFIRAIEEILKAKIYIKEKTIRLKINGKELPIKFASSGQQELLWVFLTIIYLILNKKTSFVVIEEPEAHLFPATQKEFVGMFALLHNLTDTTLFITTHSPYILTSFNNLIYAYSVASKSGEKEKVSKVIDKNFWLNPDKVNAFYVKKGEIEDIMDIEENLIKAEIIDEISNEINREFDALLDIEVGEDE